MSLLRKPIGFTLIEVLVALVILSIALLSLAGLMTTTTKNNATGGHLTEAATIAQNALEQLRVSPLGYISPAYNTTTVAPSGITYTWGWVASANIPPPNNTLDTITITVNWRDATNVAHAITLVSAVPIW